METWQSINSLEEIQGEWNSLLLRSKRPNFFSCWEWTKAWWEIYGPGKELYLLALRKANQLIGIAPCYIAKQAGLGVISFLGSGVSDQLGFIIAEGQEENFLLSLKGQMERDSRWNLWDLQEVSSLSAEAPFFEKAFSSFYVQRFLQSKLPYVELPPTWEEWLARFNKKKRDKMKYYPRLLNRNFSWRIERLSPPKFQEGLRVLYRLNQARWLRRLIPTPVMFKKFRAFHNFLASFNQAADFLRLFILFIEEKPAAVLYGFAFAQHFYFYLCGQDPEYAPFGLGYILQVYCLQEAIKEGLRVFDFLRGLERYKLSWNPSIRENWRFLMRRSQLRSKMLASFFETKQSIELAVKRKAGRI